MVIGHPVEYHGKESHGNPLLSLKRQVKSGLSLNGHYIN